MRVGDVVIPNRISMADGKCLHCGSGRYTHAIVGSMDPFVLVSDDGAMVWSVDWHPNELIALCQASEVIQMAVRKRLDATGEDQKEYGRCSDCGLSQRITAKGFIADHGVVGLPWYLCGGSGKEPKPLKRRLEIPADKVLLGHCVIINHFDRPDTGLISIVVGVDGVNLIGEYLSADQDMEPIRASMDFATPVNGFGVRVITDGKMFWVERDESLEPYARYTDDEPRNWQGRLNRQVLLSDKWANRLKSNETWKEFLIERERADD